MKKIYLLFLSTLCASFLIAQPVITDTTNFPPSGYVVPLSIGTAPGGPGPAGAAQTWDFSGLSLSTVGSQSYWNPSDMPYAASWPSANIGFFLTNPGPTQYNFLLGSPTKLEFLATEITAGPGSGNEYSNPQTILKFPFNYGDTITDVYQKIGFSADVFLLSYDSYGTLMMPGGNTYTNVARIKFAYSGGNDYVFWSTNPLMPLVIYQYATNGIIYFGAPGTGLNSEKLIDFSVYPNPATNQIKINSNEIISNIACFNSAGQSINVKLENGNIDISSFKSGLYYLVITTSDGKQGIAQFTKQ